MQIEKLYCKDVDNMPHTSVHKCRHALGQQALRCSLLGLGLYGRAYIKQF
jgi:hypothetical protein